MQSGNPTVGGSNPLSAFTNAVPVVGVNPKIETVRLDTHCRKGTAGCKETRLDASRAAGLARRHLRPNQGSDAVARQLEYRAHVSTGPGKPSRFLPVVAGAATD